MAGQDPNTFAVRTAALTGTEKIINPAATPEETFTTEQLKDYVLTSVPTTDDQNANEVPTEITGDAIITDNVDSKVAFEELSAAIQANKVVVQEITDTDLATAGTPLVSDVTTLALKKKIVWYGGTVANPTYAFYVDGDGVVVTLKTPVAASATYYDAGLGFWVMGTAGITVTSSAAGAYTMTIPVGGKIDFYHKNFTAANIGTELDGSGNFTLTSNFNQANTGWDDAILPTLHGWANGQQYFIGATGQASTLGISMGHSLPSGGSYTTTFTGVSGSVGGVPTQIKGSF